MVNQHAKWLEKCSEVSWRAPVSSLNLLITSTVWRQDHNGFTHQDPGFLDVVVNKSPERRAHLPAAGRQLPAVGRRPLPAEHQLHQRHRRGQAEASAIPRHGRGDRALHQGRRHLGLGEQRPGRRARRGHGALRRHADDGVAGGHRPAARAPSRASRSGSSTWWICSGWCRTREHPHGLSDREFETLFTADKPIIFNFHAYPWLIHRLTYRRPNQHNIHVRGYKEQGNINTPLELAIRNQIDRFSLAIDAIDRVPRLGCQRRRRSRGSARPADRMPEPRLRERHRCTGDHRLAVAVLRSREPGQWAKCSSSRLPGDGTARPPGVCPASTPAGPICP